MNRGPLTMRSAVDPVAKAQSAWGEDLPNWVLVLAETCQKTTQASVAKRIDYSPAVVSSVLSNSYKGDIGSVEQAVRWELMSETVACPALGEIARKTCVDWQAKPYAATSAHRAAMYHACRSKCPHSRLVQRGDDDAL
ncbi:transcriptional regulator [Allorhizobium pseudoryzae]|uniref:transcriptional regulator n=1 Tax=Allorhizobium pseudoryzae TaxID=379684 RepID=UPI003CFD7D8B